MRTTIERRDGDPKQKIDLLGIGWTPDYLDPFDIVKLEVWAPRVFGSTHMTGPRAAVFVSYRHHPLRTRRRTRINGLHERLSARRPLARSRSTRHRHQAPIGADP